LGAVPVDKALIITAPSVTRYEFTSSPSRSHSPSLRSIIRHPST